MNPTLGRAVNVVRYVKSIIINTQLYWLAVSLRLLLAQGERKVSDSAAELVEELCGSLDKNILYFPNYLGIKYF